MLQNLSTTTPASEVSSTSFGDDGSYSAEGESKALADIMRNSPAAALLGLDAQSQSEEEVDDSTPEDTSEEQEAQDTDESSEDDLGEDKTEDESEEDTESKDDTSTDADLPSEEDIDWEYKVPVTVDGKTEYKTLEEIRKGYSTDQHLSQKGRELGELKKQIEVERTEKLQEVITLGTVLHEELTLVEATYADQYTKLTAEIEKAKEEGDSYTARELKEKRETAQEQYWAARNKREANMKAVTEKFSAEQLRQQQASLTEYNSRIKDVIPDYSEKVAKSVREFAIKEGIPEVMLDAVYSPEIVKFINDYRKLKVSKDTGAEKRKAAPAAKSIPTKKGQTSSAKQAANQSSLRSRVMSGQSSNTDQMDFLKNISSISRKL